MLPITRSVYGATLTRALASLLHQYGPCSSCARTVSAASGAVCPVSGSTNKPDPSIMVSQLLRSVRYMSSMPAGRVVSYPLAQTGEGISECELIAWHVKEGDAVEEFQPICEVQSDKASIEITSRYSGTIVRIHHSKGDMVKVGAPLLDMVVLDGAADEAPAAAESAAAAGSGGHAGGGGASSDADTDTDAGRGGSSAPVLASPAVRRLAREMAVELTAVAGTGPGGRVLKDDIIAAAEGTSRHAAAVEATAVLEAAAAAAGVSGAVGLGDAALSLGRAAAATAMAASEDPAPAATHGDHSADVHAMELPAATVGGGAAANAGTQAAFAVLSPARPPPTHIPLRGYRRAMARSAAEAAVVPTFHYMDEMMMDELMRVRAHVKQEAGRQLLGASVKLTYLPFVVKALSVTLGRFPAFNVQMAPGGAELLQLHSHNIGVAMATGGGLVVPNVKSVEHKTIPQIAHELAHLQQLAAAGKLTTEHLTGGSLTISNIGTIGGIYATPMLNPPEAAIVALGRVRTIPRYDASSGDLVRRHVMGFSWGADHRVVDGATVAEFSNAFKSLLEEPSCLLLHLR